MDQGWTPTFPHSSCKRLHHHCLPFPRSLSLLVRCLVRLVRFLSPLHRKGSSRGHPSLLRDSAPCIPFRECPLLWIRPFHQTPLFLPPCRRFQCRHPYYYPLVRLLRILLPPTLQPLLTPHLLSLNMCHRLPRSIRFLSTSRCNISPVRLSLLLRLPCRYHLDTLRALLNWGAQGLRRILFVMPMPQRPIYTVLLSKVGSASQRIARKSLFLVSDGLAKGPPTQWYPVLSRLVLPLAPCMVLRVGFLRRRHSPRPPWQRRKGRISVHQPAPFRDPLRAVIAFFPFRVVQPPSSRDLHFIVPIVSVECKKNDPCLRGMRIALPLKEAYQTIRLG